MNNTEENALRELKSLGDKIAEIGKRIEELDTIEINGKKIRVSRSLIVLPCDPDGHLIGIDAEVIWFHCKRTGISVNKSRWIDPGQIVCIPKSEKMFTERSHDYYNL